MTITYTLEHVRFEWDADKAQRNWQKHGVSFETACEVLLDPFVKTLELQDVEHEIRTVIVGMTSEWRLLYVVHTVETGDVFRLISARRATRAERIHYEEQ